MDTGVRMSKQCKTCGEWKSYSDYFDDRFRTCRDCYTVATLITKGEIIG